MGNIKNVYDLVTHEAVEVENAIPTDRSRYVTGLACSRKRFYDYQSGPDQKGFDSSNKYDDLVVGSAVHAGMDIAVQAWKQCQDDGIVLEVEQLAVTVFQMTMEYVLNEAEQNTLVMGGDPLMKVINPELYDDLAMEQAVLAGILAGGAVMYWLPQIMEDYEILMTETEISWRTSAATKVVMMSRPDAVIRRRADGKVFVVSYKTTKTFYSSDIERLNYDIQALTEMGSVLAAGYEPDGILYLYFIKGSRKRVFDGDEGLSVMRYTSPLVRPYINPSSREEVSPEFFRTRYESLPDPMTGRKTRLTKEWVQISGWTPGTFGSMAEYGVTPLDWFQWLISGAFDDEHAGPPLQQLLASPDPIIRPEEQIHSIMRQIVYAEEWNAEYMITYKKHIGDEPKLYFAPSDELKNFLDLTFPQNPSSCLLYNRPCRWVEICWGEKNLGQIFIEKDLSVRTPNHLQEDSDGSTT